MDGILPGAILALFTADKPQSPQNPLCCLWNGRMPTSRIAKTDERRLRQTLLIGCLLAAATLTLYWQVQFFDFVNFDDGLYVADNSQVRSGLSIESIKWSFMTFHAGNWHPLTWISHMADFEAYQLNAGGHHWTSVLIHTASAVLLFLVLSSMTGALWRSALAAALFAIHPLHVESVAWVAERKDVLSGFFWILTMGVYSHYVRQATFRRYLLVLGSFVLGLLSKPMMVTLPFVLLLLDYWPLGRFTGANTAFDKWVRPATAPGKDAMLRLVLEKIPFLILVAASCIVTVYAQRSADSIASLGHNPVEVRLANALVSYAEYIQKMLWPVDLAVMYPHAGMPASWMIATALLLLGSISYVAFRKAREMPFLLVGWLWYLGTLVPVIGLVQVGSQSMADRYTYLPLVGIFMVIAWGAQALVERRPMLKYPVLVFSLVVIAGLLSLAKPQVETWENGVTLFEHALAVTEQNPLAHNNLGAAYDVREGSCKKASPHFMRAIELKNDYADAYDNLGTCAFREGDHEGAIRYFQWAAEVDPKFTRARVNLGLMMMNYGKVVAAEEAFRQVLQIDPSLEAAHVNLGALCINQGKLDDAAIHLRETLRINPRNADAHNNLGVISLRGGRVEDALRHFRQALTAAPEHPTAEMNIRLILAERAR